MKTCVICGAVLTGRQTVVCGKRCRNRRNVQSDAYKATRRRYETTAKYKAALKRKRDRDRAGGPTCERCGEPSRPDAHYCSHACWVRATRAQYVSERLPVLAEAAWCELPADHAVRRLTVETVVGTPRWIAGDCRRCGRAFVAVDQLTTLYCSPRCARSDARDRRRARKRQAYVERVIRRKVFDRDGWRCQICRSSRRIDPTREPPHAKAATIDHIIPLALGGKHEPVNCQTAHYICNCRKTAKGVGDQLRLIA